MSDRFVSDDSEPSHDRLADSFDAVAPLSAARDESIAIWRRSLAPPLPALDLPTDRPRPTTCRPVDATHAFQFTEELVAALVAKGSQDQRHPLATLLAGFATLLARYSSQDDLVVAYAVRPDAAGQIEPHARPMHVLPLRVDFSGSPSFGEIAERVRQQLDTGAAHRGLPLGELSEQLGFGREAGDGLPLRAILAFHDQTDKADSNGVCHYQLWTGVDAAQAPVDLFLTIVRQPGRWEAAIRYRSDLFDADRIRRMPGHLSQLLCAAAKRPETPLAELPLLTPAEVAQFAEWNRTGADFPRQATIAEAFERQVDATPGAAALLFGEQRWTYAELNDRADRLAGRLRQAGIAAGVPVGVFLERSPDLIAALLAILKAGGVYVPLNPNDPPERLQFISLDADVRLVVANEASASHPVDWDVPVLRLDGDDVPKPLHRAHSPRAVAAEDPAYILFTSGSTGHPKGVAVSHRAVLRLVKGTNYLPFAASDIFLQYANTSFDAATLEIWGPLLNGGQLAIAPPGVLSLAELGQSIRRHQVTTLWLTSGLFHQMVEHRLSDLSGLKHLLAGGDVLSPEHVAKVRAGLPNVTLINGYGPTENTTFTTCHIMRGAEPAPPGAVPIGRPIANTQVYILDRRLQRVPIGVPGEICCGGDGLAIGYVNRPELNEQSFFNLPADDGHMVRLYKTGDLGRYRSDGAIEFLGRQDRQVKIRGFRADPAEVEAQLCRHSAVRDAAVVVTVDATLHKQLTAYAAVGDGPAPSAKDLQAFLSAALPSYMVPSQFVCLKRLPLDANGKVDRKRLPSAPRAAQHASGEMRATGNVTERRLVHVWQAVFDDSDVDLHDDFFELGGDSLMAVALLARLEDEFGVALQLTDLVEHPTVGSLAKLLAETASFRTRMQAVEIQPGGSRPPLFFVPCINGNLMTIRSLAARLDFDQPVFGLQPLGVDGRDKPHESLSDLAEHYLQQVRAAQPRGPYYFMGYSLGGTVAFEMAHRLTDAGASVGLLMLVDAPFRSRPWIVRQGQELVERLGPRAAAVFRRLAGADGVPATPAPHNAKMIAAQRRALVEYRAQPYRGPAVIFRAIQRSHGFKRVTDMLTLDWKGYGLVDRETPVLWSPGDHTTMFAKPHVDVLAKMVQQQLDAAFAQPQRTAPAYSTPMS